MSISVFHPLTTSICPPDKFTYPFYYVPHPLTQMAAGLLQHYLGEQRAWAAELEQGKMFGVLVVRRGEEIGFLAAYSGLLNERCDHPYFVPPIYDSQHPDGIFKREEAAISAINRRISAMETDAGRVLMIEQLAQLNEKHQQLICAYKVKMNEAKRLRDARRPIATEEERAAMVKESQFMKAELARMKRRMTSERESLQTPLSLVNKEIEQLKEERRRRSESLQQWLFRQFVVSNGRGEQCHLLDLFQQWSATLPPSGAGDCCAPRLLQYAYAHQYVPLCMGEFWWGRSPKGEVRHHLHFYPACRAKCLPILSFMLQGLDVDPNPLAFDDEGTLEVIEDNEWFCIVNKPAGMLSVRGKSERRSVETLLRERWGNTAVPLMVHRLDMDTSGLLIVAKSREILVALQQQFAERRVKKCYVALLSGVWQGAKEGVISLPLRPNPLDRPRQVVDMERGKEAVTKYRVRTVIDGRTLMELYPLTGRTHQLRLHCAHPDGLALPIVGDVLYGRPNKRLYLHAEEIAFLHPVTSEPMSFRCQSLISMV